MQNYHFVIVVDNTSKTIDIILLYILAIQIQIDCYDLYPNSIMQILHIAFVKAASYELYMSSVYEKVEAKVNKLKQTYGGLLITWQLHDDLQLKSPVNCPFRPTLLIGKKQHSNGSLKMISKKQA